MATETHETQEEQPQVSQGLVVGLSMLGGIGITLMVGAAAVGVVNAEADAGQIGIIVLLGAGLLVMAIAGWVAAVQPHKHFDDINVPQYTGHHGDEHHDDAHHAEEHTDSH